MTERTEEGPDRTFEPDGDRPTGGASRREDTTHPIEGGTEAGALAEAVARATAALGDDAGKH